MEAPGGAEPAAMFNDSPSVFNFHSISDAWAHVWTCAEHQKRLACLRTSLSIRILCSFFDIHIHAWRCGGHTYLKTSCMLLLGVWGSYLKPIIHSVVLTDQSLQLNLEFGGQLIEPYPIPPLTSS
jgi:hypothetical protein